MACKLTSVLRATIQTPLAFLPRRSPTRKKKRKKKEREKGGKEEDEDQVVEKGEGESWKKESERKYIEQSDVELELEVAVTGWVLVARFLEAS